MKLVRISKLMIPALLGGVMVFSAAGAGATTTVAAKRRPTPTPAPPRPTAVPTPQPGPVCWNVVAAPNIPGFDTVLTSVHGSGPNDVWAVGHFATLINPNNPNDPSGSTHTLTLHWNGVSWTQVPSPDAIPAAANVSNNLTGVYAIAPNDVWAVGGSGGGDQPGRSLTLHWNGAIWQIVASPVLEPIPGVPSGNALTGVSAVASNDVWAVGNATSPAVNGARALMMHWNGSAWTQSPAPIETAIWSDAARTGVTAVAANDVWAVGQFSAFRWNGSAWTVPAGFSGQNLLGVDHSSANNVWSVGTIGVTAGGEGGGSGPVATSYRFNGTSWTFTTPELAFTGNSTAFNGVSALAPNNVWAVGYLNRSTLTQRWDGTAWHVVASANGNPNPSPNGAVGNVLNSVHANSATDIWAVGFFYDSAFQSRALIERYVCQ